MLFDLISYLILRGEAELAWQNRRRVSYRTTDQCNQEPNALMCFMEIDSPLLLDQPGSMHTANVVISCE